MDQAESSEPAGQATTRVNPRWIIWPIVLAVILGLGWYKADENRRDLQAQQDYDARLKVLELESAEHFESDKAYISDLLAKPPDDARQVLEENFNNGKPFATTKEDRYDVAHWRSPLYGYQFSFDFLGNHLAAWGSRWGSGQIGSVYPRPERFSREGNAEKLRSLLVWWMQRCVLFAAVAYAIFRRMRRSAAEAMLAFSMAFGVAVAVSPYYSLDARGVFSNDTLVFAALACLLCLFALARHVPAAPGRFQFRMIHLLALMTGLAILMAMGAFGYFVLLTTMAGGVAFLFFRWFAYRKPEQLI